jgi:peptidoglycan/xylan/chitin deacetylase (PgdA/CDA1 family)
MPETLGAIFIPCLVYHRLHQGAGPLNPGLRAFSLEVSLFRSHMEALQSAGYRAASLADFVSWKKGAGRPPAKPLLITFDDGWASNLSLALPVMKQLHFPCTIFVVADRGVEVFNEGGDLDRALTDEEVAQLADEGVSIQSHGLTHRPFTEMHQDELNLELRESRRRLEALTGKPVEWLAAPFGLANRTVEAAARAAGYIGFDQGLTGANSLSTDLFSLRRLGVRPSWSADDLLGKLTPDNLRRAALTENFKRRIRLSLGQRNSARLRSFIRGKTAC